MASSRRMPARSTWARKSGVVSTTMLWSRCLIRIDGRRRVSRGSVELQTSQEQPIVGTPELVPEPSTVIFKSIYARFDSGKVQRFLLDLRKVETQSGDGVVKRLLLQVRKITFRLLLQHGKQIYIVAGLVEIRPGLILAGRT